MKRITVSLPENLRNELEEVCLREGIPRGELVRQSLRDYLFARQFRPLRREMSRKASKRGIVTDEDVFKTVSCPSTLLMIPRQSPGLHGRRGCLRAANSCRRCAGPVYCPAQVDLSGEPTAQTTRLF